MLSNYVPGNYPNIDNPSALGKFTSGELDKIAAAVSLSNQAISALPATAVGSWTPIDTSGAGLTFTSVTAGYTKIGNIVFVYARLTYPTTASGVQAAIGGLPFAVAAPLYAQNPHPMYTTNNIGVAMWTLSGSTVLNPFTSTTGAAVSNVNLSASVITFSASYPVT